MARNRQIGPSARVAPSPRVALPSTAQVRAEYDAMLSQELGPAVFNRAPSRDDGRPVGLLRLMFRPAGLFGIALMAMFAVVGIKLWREGVFESFRIKHTAIVQTGDKSWMLGDRQRPHSLREDVLPVRSDRKPAEPAVPVSDDAAPAEDAPE